MSKLYDPTYVPKSARLNFTVGVSDKASASDKYDALVASVKECNTIFETKQKENIILAAELELEVLSNDKKTLFCEAFYEIAAIFYLWKRKCKDIDEASVHKIVLETLSFDISILQYVFDTDVKIHFINHYNKIYPTSVGIVTIDDGFNSLSDELLSQIQLPTSRLPTTNTIEHYYGINNQRPTIATTTTPNLPTEDVDNEATYNYDNDYTNDNTTNNNNNNNNDINNKNSDDDIMTDNQPSILHHQDIIQLSNLLQKSFVTTWTKHLNETETRILNATLAKYATLRIKSKVTDRAAAIVASEPAATPQIMSDLIKKAVSKENEYLLKKVSKLEQQLSRSIISKSPAKNIKNHNHNNAKNDTRGETKTRALALKKSKNTTNTTTKNGKKSTSSKKSSTSNATPKRKAGDANNATKKDNKKSSKSNKKTNSTGKTNIMQHTKRNKQRTPNKV
jgi:hypothetical protein